MLRSPETVNEFLVSFGLSAFSRIFSVLIQIIDVFRVIGGVKSSTDDLQSLLRDMSLVVRAKV